MIYLLAYPRSGSSYIRYLLGVLTESKPMQPQGHCEMDHLLSQHYKNEPYIKKFHYPKDGNTNIVKGDNKLALIQRDPIENTLSFMLSNEMAGKKNHSDEFISNYINDIISNKKHVFERYGNDYKNNLNFYRKWNGEKIIISYEEIMTSPESELKRISKFFGYDNERVDLLMSDIDYHSSAVLSHKMQKNDPFSVNTKGKVLDKFNSVLTEENKNYLHSFFKQ
jgi:hypothetical protein